MAIKSLLVTLAVCVGAVSAWLPNDAGRTIVDRNGFSLFGNTPAASTRRGDAGEKRYLPSSGGKIRGVNLGSLFIFEPWIGTNTWKSMGCTDSGYNSEFDCMTKLGQDQGDSVFQNHWKTWVTAADFDEMAGYGLNTVRIPLGYWMDESLVYQDSEHFPKGGVDVLKTVCGWAAAKGFYVILV
jgi:aryl-phospho-beta-D-glucosidase BglC (GH1 family)